jgi:uncharacterized membrane protein YbhN (UPF0104 family)
MSVAHRWLAQAWRPALLVGVVAAGLWTATHGVAGVGWREVGVVLRGVSVVHLVWLAALWLAGLVIYAGAVLAPALPGLTAGRGLMMNLTGSAVANVMPLGGAAATALNWRMVRGWGHSNGAFVGFCVTTNVLDVLSKLALPVVAVTALAAASAPVPTAAWMMAAGCGAALLLAGVLHAVDRIRALLSSRWHRLVPGSIAYLVAQVLLLDASLYAVGLHPPVVAVLMAAAVERLGTLVPITPGGAGIAEIGAVAWLVGSGLDPVQAVAGVLLYRVFVFALEIPVGGALLGGWAWWERARTRTMTGASA